MNWSVWFQGLIVALASSAYTVISSLVILKTPPSGWELAVIAGGPFVLGFLGFIKQTPPPIGEKKVLSSGLKMLILGIFIIPILFLGCATSWQKDMTKGYVAAGAVGKVYYEQVKNSCTVIPPATSTVLSTDKCEKLKKINNDARKAYIVAGDVLVLAIQTDDAVQQQTLLTNYNTLLADFNRIMLEFVKLINEYKIKK